MSKILAKMKIHFLFLSDVELVSKKGIERRKGKRQCLPRASALTDCMAGVLKCTLVYVPNDHEA